MKIFYTVDLHAAESTFRKFTNAGPFYKADMVIFGGDFSGKMVVPIIKETKGWSCTYYGCTVSIKREEELPDLKKNLRDCGFYPLEITAAEIDKLSENDVDRIIEQKQKEIAAQWMKLADERFRRNGIPCVFIPGNADARYLDEIFSSVSYIQNGDGKVIEINGYEILSIADGHPTKFKWPREVAEEELLAKIDKLAGQVKDMSRCIFNIHVPPYDTDLDQDTLYDDDLNPILDGGELASGSTGSKAVRAAIEKYQPLLSLHGHVHGSRGVTKIGKTICINPGSDYDQGMLRGALIDIDTRGNVNYTLTSG